MKSIRRMITAIVLLLTLFFPSKSYGVNNNFEIKNYDIRMDVGDDNSYLITETIDVHFNVKRHGIIRDIPVKTYMGNRAEIRNVKVQGHKYKVSTDNNELKIQIGDNDKYAKTDERYVISYIYDIGYDNITKMDELYFNLIGTGWDVYIRNVTFSITMPFPFDSSMLNFTYGKAGSIENKDVKFNVGGTKITGKLNKELGPYEALTVALPLPEGYYVNAKKKFDMGVFIQEKYLYIFLGAVLIALIIWFLLGRNRRIFPAVEFHAPKGLTPADAGYIYNGRVSSHHITSLIIYWADKGYLQIQEYVKNPKKPQKTSLVLHKLRDMGPEAKEYERLMFNSLFISYGAVNSVEIDSLKNRFYKTIKIISNKLKSIWYDNEETRIYRKGNGLLAVFIQLFALVTSVTASYGLYYNFNQDTFKFIIAPSLVFGVFMILPVWRLTALIAKWNMILPSKRVWCTIKNILFFAVTLGVVSYFTPEKLYLMTISAYASCFIISLLAENSGKRTEVGDMYMERIIGFRDFILHAEKDRINMLVEQNPGYYFSVLPYAMVFGITDKWARKFEGITLQPPNWYRPYYPYNYFDSVRFASTINESMNRMARTLSSAPGSSSSSDYGGSFGGGSSGGGSGGGGGSDW